jgi:hypothetical protein
MIDQKLIEIIHQIEAIPTTIQVDAPTGSQYWSRDMTAAWKECRFYADATAAAFKNLLNAVEDFKRHSAAYKAKVAADRSE